MTLRHLLRKSPTALHWPLEKAVRPGRPGAIYGGGRSTEHGKGAARQRLAGIPLPAAILHVPGWGVKGAATTILAMFGIANF